MNKRTFVYPGSDLDRSKNLLAVLGTFWATTFGARDQVQSYAAATAATVAQTHRNLFEVASALSRFDVPVFHEQYWTPLVFRQSDLNNDKIAVARFDNTADVFDGALFFDRAETSNKFALPAPPKLVQLGQIFNQIAFPTVALLPGIDFYVDTLRGAIVFAQNPFENPGVVKRVINNNGASDIEIVLWGFSGQYDYEYVFNQFAYAFDIYLQSSENYKTLTNTVFDSLLAGGISAKNLDSALAAICDTPVVLDPQEVVEEIQEDGQGLFISTDRHVYRFQYNVEPVVSIGQRVRAGQPLVDSFDITEFAVGNYFTELQDDTPLYREVITNFLITNGLEFVAAENDDEIILDTDHRCPVRKPPLAALALDNGFISACFYSDLVFENRVVPLRVNTTHPSGYTYVDFELNGLPGDVRHFFDEIHLRGITARERRDECVPATRRLGTLAHALDRRQFADTEPGPDDLPSFINPLQFLIENALRNNVFVVRITVSALGQKQLGLYNIRRLRQLLPPQTAMIVVFELKIPPDAVAADSRVTEYVEQFTGMEVITDSAPNENVLDLGATIFAISGTCH